MENPLYRSKSYFSGQNLTKFYQKNREKKRKKTILTLKAPKKQPSMYTHNIFLYFYGNKKTKKTHKERRKKSPHTQKYTLKSFQDHRASECMHKERRRGGRVGRSRSFFFITELVPIIPPVVDSVSFLS
jgi:hypothetical protein